MTWQVLILAYALAGAFMTLQSRALARRRQTRHASMAINAVAFTAVFVLGVLFVLLAGPVDWAQIKAYWGFMVAAAMCFALSSVYLYRALAYMESANVSVVMTMSSIFTMAIAGVTLGERLNLLQLLGIGILLPCIWFVLTLAGKERRDADIRRFARLKGFSHAMTASLLLAVGTVTEKYILDHVTAPTYIGAGFTLQMIAAWMLVLIFRRRTLVVLKDMAITTQALRLGVLRAIAGVAFLYALVRSDSASLMSVVANFRIIIVTILAAVLLKENRHLQQKLLAAAIAFVALSIIFWN